MGRAEVKGSGVKQRSRAKGKGAEARGSGETKVKSWVEQRPRVGRGGRRAQVTPQGQG